ncbi:hypothetical protein ACIBO2_44730 [Nonomuraea sp. NPDC050022]|uniref:hypothetical protein n=1 Tax=unclassified Nonomuraea TaxID=2593643 RepID=UPI0033C64A65
MTAPHSHWRLLQQMERLAHGHDQAGTALARYAAETRRPPAGPFPWWSIPAALTAAFLGWTSADALQTVTGGVVPLLIAFLPGLALAGAVTGTTVITATAFRDFAKRPVMPVLTVLCGISVIGGAVWVTLWLESTLKAARSIAFAAGVLLILGVAAATFGAVFWGGSRHSLATNPERSRRVRARRKLAEKAIRSHEQAWMGIAHQTGVLLMDSPEARATLLRLIDGKSEPIVPDDLDPVHALMLTGLRDHCPRDLTITLARIDAGGS